MTKTTKKAANSFWVTAITVGILACLGGVAYTFFLIQQEASEE